MGGGGPCYVKQRVLTSFNQLNTEGRFLKKKAHKGGGAVKGTPGPPHPSYVLELVRHETS